MLRGHDLWGALARFGLLLLLPAAACQLWQQPTAISVQEGVSRDLAASRAARVRQLRYHLAFNIPSSSRQPIPASEEIRFQLTRADQSLLLDFKAGADRIASLSVNDDDQQWRIEKGHILLPPKSLKVGENRVRLQFMAGDRSLNRRDDYLYTLFVPDHASDAFPCFDQPDLKGRFQLELGVPAGWEVVANGAVMGRREGADRTQFSFAETPPISTYLFAFVAGKFKVETARRDGRILHMYHRESDQAKVARNREAIFDLHAAALKWLEQYTGIAYPFEKFDFVLIPSFQFGGMEHPGAILYRASSLMLDPSATRSQQLARASVIAHETTHMWFGDLVTMRWFNDVWMKEVFANFMAAKIVNPSFPKINHRLRFLLSHYPQAYAVDRTAGTHPIRQELDNLNDAASLYGPIIYQKAPIVMEHLEQLVGAGPFQTSIRRYLQENRFGNAGWPELISIMSSQSGEDLGAWSKVWVEGAGRPVLRTQVAGDGLGGAQTVSLKQEDPLGRHRTWDQQLQVLTYRAGKPFYSALRMNRDVQRLQPPGRGKIDFILPNGRGEGYGLFLLDPAGRDYLLQHLPEVRKPLTRATAWIDLRENMLEGAIPPLKLIELAERALPKETEELTVQRILQYLTGVYWRFIPARERTRLAPRLERLLWRQVQRAGTTSLKSSFFRAYQSVALTPGALGRLRRIWARQESIKNLPLSERDESGLARQLALREVPGWKEILNKQLQRIKDPERRQRFAFVMPALDADPAVRANFFKSLAQLENRRHEPWVLEGLRELNHPLRAAQAIGFIRPGLDLLQEIKQTGDIFFPKGWLDALLGGHNSKEAAGVVRDFLDRHPDYPKRLRRKILQSADGLFRAANIVSGGR